MLQTSFLHTKSLSKAGTPFLNLSCVVFFFLFCFQGQQFILLFYFTAAGVKCIVVAVELLAVLHYSTDYNFIFFGIIEPILVSLEWSCIHVYARGCKQCCKLHYCLLRISIKPRLPFSICNVFFVANGQHFIFNYNNHSEECGVCFVLI